MVWRRLSPCRETYAYTLVTWRLQGPGIEPTTYCFTLWAEWTHQFEVNSTNFMSINLEQKVYLDCKTLSQICLGHMNKSELRLSFHFSLISSDSQLAQAANNNKTVGLWHIWQRCFHWSGLTYVSPVMNVEWMKECLCYHNLVIIMKKE